jgi:hypothetical protein
MAPPAYLSIHLLLQVLDVVLQILCLPFEEENVGLGKVCIYQIYL